MDELLDALLIAARRHGASDETHYRQQFARVLADHDIAVIETPPPQTEPAVTVDLPVNGNQGDDDAGRGSD